MIYSDNKRDDIVRYENPEELSSEEDNENHFKSYIDFNYDSEDESKLNSTLKKDSKIKNNNPNISKPNDSDVQKNSEFYANFKHESKNFTDNNYHLQNLDKLEKEEIKDNQNNICSKKSKSILSNTNIDNNHNTIIIQSNACKENTNKFYELNDLLKHQEKKVSVFDKYKIQTKEISTQALAINSETTENKYASLLANTNSSRDLKKFINVEVAFTPVNNGKKEISKVDKGQLSNANTMREITHNTNSISVNASTTKPILKSYINTHAAKNEKPVINKNISLINKGDEEDLDVELVAVSIQITNFNQSFEDDSDAVAQKTHNHSTLSNSQTNGTKIAEEFERKNLNEKDDKNSKNLLIDNGNNLNNTLNSPFDIKNKDINQEKNSEENIKLLKELEELKSKFEQKNREAIDYKTKYNRVLLDYEAMEKKFSDYKQQVTIMKNEQTQKENSLNLIKQDLKKKEDLIQNQNGEILNYQNQIEKIKSEFTTQRSEITKKAEKITELQQRIFILEQDILEIRNKTHTEAYSLRDQNENLEIYKSNYIDLKKQHELLNIKSQSFAEENTSIRRDLILYEKEVNLKNDTIHKLNNEVSQLAKQTQDLRDRDINKNIACHTEENRPLNNTINSSLPQSNRSETQFYQSNGKKANKSMSMLDNSLNMTYNDNINSVMVDNIYRSSYANNTYNQNERSIRKNLQESKNKKNSINDSSILPSQQHLFKNESKILDIELKLYTLQQERDKVASELAKMPDFPKQKMQILTKKNLELSINEYSISINKQRAELRELNVLNRDY